MLRLGGVAKPLMCDEKRKNLKVVNLLWVPIKKFQICIINLAAQAKKAGSGRGKEKESTLFDLCIVSYYYKNTMFIKRNINYKSAKGLKGFTSCLC